VTHESAYTAIREAFQHLTRQIEHRIERHAQGTSTTTSSIS
jgi:hypothetical protein